MFELPRDWQEQGNPRPAIDLDFLLAEQARTLARSVRVRPPLTRFLPVPRAIELAGEVLVVGELTLNDVAELQAFLERSRPGPLDQETIAEAWQVATTWPPRYGMPEGDRILAKPAGRAELLRVALRQELPEADRLLEIASGAKATEWITLQMVAFGIAPRTELVARLAPSDDATSEADWEKRIWGLVEATGWDFERIGRLTLTQFRLACAGGKVYESSREFQARAIRAGRVVRSSN